MKDFFKNWKWDVYHVGVLLFILFIGITLFVFLIASMTEWIIKSNITSNIFDAQFYVIFAISTIGLIIASAWLRKVISNDLGDIVYKQYQNMFDRIDEYMAKFEDLERKVAKLNDKYQGLEERAYRNKDGIEENNKNFQKILTEIKNLK
jgi:peptidoglycan hydrolase CwlO-like protein